MLALGQAREGGTTSSPLVYPPLLVRAPGCVPRHRWPGRTVASQGDRWGTLRLTTIGRHTRQRRSVIVAYFEDGPNLIALAMNGWAEGEPAWWLNLQAHPDASVDLAGGPRPVMARAAEGEERSRLWARWRELDARLDTYAKLRSVETAVVILEPRPEPIDPVAGSGLTL